MNKKTRLCILIQLLLASAVAAQWCSRLTTGGFAAVFSTGSLLPAAGGASNPEAVAPLAIHTLSTVSLSAPSVYLGKRTRGFHGLHIPFEPTIARLNFHDALPYRNTWMGGGYAGLDFNPYVGFRGFMFKAVNFGKVKLDYDKMNMYGAEMRLRLPLTTGLTPTAMLGGGYLNINPNYKPRADQRAPNRFFAQGGLGLNLLPSSRFQVQCGIRTMLLRQAFAGGEDSSNRLYASWMYNLGVRFVIWPKSQ